MAEAVVVSGVVTGIGDLLVQEGKFSSGVSNQVELLKTELNLMQGLLKDVDLWQDESEPVAVRQWVAEIRNLVYDADDIINNFKASSERGGLIQKILKRCGCILDEGISVHKAGSVISNITKQISMLRKTLLDYGYGIRDSIIQVGGPSSLDDRKTYSSNEREREHRQTFYHLEHDVVGFEDGEGNGVASICGMGGLGKTTLAKMVYNHPNVKKHFECCAWVYISQNFQRRHVWEQILLSLQSLSREQKDEIRRLTDAELAYKLCQVQRERKCLVILDDIWGVETWNIICEAFRWRDTKSKILLTTRYKDVIWQIDPRGFMSWLLFEKIALSWRQVLFVCFANSTTNCRMINLGKEVVEYCRGLPFAIITLGGLLASKQTEDEWEYVLKHVQVYLFEDLRLINCLALSYYDFPFYLKLCFLYLGNFPKDFEIPSKELIRMWMGEGFISESGREDIMEDVGQRYLMELVQTAWGGNFLQIMNIHSMEVREMYLGKIRRLSLIWEQHNLDPLLPMMISKKYPYLRSLLCFQPHVLNSVNLLRSMFENFKSLRVLSLENSRTHSGDLPEDIGCLIHLKFFFVKNSNIHNLPSSLGNLRWLQTLLPNVFKKMEQLRHLYLPKEYKVNEKLELANPCCLLTLVNVEFKTIQMDTSFKFNNLQILSSCPHLSKLNLHSPIQKLPEAYQFSPNLAKLTLIGSLLEVDPMPTLEKLPKLKILRLFNDAFAGTNMVCSERGSPLLQSLVVYELINLVEWCVEEGAMPNLSHLQISKCLRLRTIPGGLRFISTLQELEIKCMPKSFKDKLDEGKPNFDKVRHVPSLVFQDCWE
ncbi:hypothetical protein RGQ29_005046 [Quercus rubra]|uniref:Uncharacterized protein n=1 Tax=Quercus rubra TaxID=3512 RepID=A0AAN7E474_QUERU|nr:hypothetical protein RGQ29_005046 [Quercus rubra]